MKADQIYDQYWKSGKHADPHWSKSRIEAEFHHLKDCSRILDYGSGPISRKYGDVLAAGREEYVGADISPYIVDDNARSGFQSTLIDPSSGRINKPEASFDGAVCCEVFEHLYDPLAAAREIHRLLKPSGRFVAMVPHFGYHAWRVQALIRAQVPHEPEDPLINCHNGVHIRYFSILTFRRLLEDAGFTNIRIRAYDFSSIWDVTRGLGRLACVSDWARKHLAPPLHLTWLQNFCPSVFAMRLKAECIK